MKKKLLAAIKSLVKPLLTIGLVLALVFGQADGAMAARSGGRMGGGSFRMPSRSYSAPSRTYSAPRGVYPGGGYYPGGGGFGFPFLIPLFGFGGGFGGLFSILIFMAIAGFLVRSFRQIASGSSEDYNAVSSPIASIAQVQVGLLASARTLQADLDRIAQNANTGSSAGLAQALQETTLSLLRHPEYWVYGGAQSQQARLEAAEAQFNRLALAERSKFTEETLTNVNSQLTLKSAQSSTLAVAEKGGALTDVEGPGEYIIATILVGAMGNLQLPVINSSEDLRRALSQIGAISSDRLLALEVLWAPQAEGDTLTSEDVITQYPTLKLV
ncbi:hypothetical protein BST81_04520 [Leptolyngbya sp. 'hensonii']|uniref:DUF1517 domain-containing protein n=1 Tax=Leptolyngbya sp. 'hensonii' TaxID=1922337 RepID=UPI00094F8EC4|nr:DUF1517 domain-containing protein [Leptolyngbya sp. 'hensonii']OLP19540.1 hypothetical protein BST81_04520 [Leptolyngbya sp. 'hensonii']